MRLALGAALLAAITLAASACGSGRSTHETSGRTVSSSRLVAGGAVRCTATVRTPVQVGHDLDIAFSFHNLTTRAVSVRVSYGGMWLIVSSPDGTRYDTRVPLENSNGPATPPIAIPAGRTKTERLRGDFRVRWGGPLRVTPGCGLLAAPPMRVAVSSPGLPESPTAAVDDVVAATGNLLDHCRPRTAGVSVVGRIDPPTGNSPPLQARCSITLQRKNGFYVAQVLILTPPDLRGVHVDSTYEALSGAYARNRNRQAIAWAFVVTREGATSVAAASNQTGRPGGGRAPDWMWSSSGPRRLGDSLCGFSGGSFGSGDGPEVSFLAGCGR